MAGIHDILKQYFGYDAFRPLQEDVIRQVLAGNDCLALLPTGGGKSVCYQVPALAQDGICLVITPLIALMKDQVSQLRKRNISALSIHSGMAFYEVKKALENATTGEYKFLYVSPERLQTKLFNEYLPAMPINLVAVDEAHCISQWGYDFRPAYLEIAEIRAALPGIPVLALTASATADVQEDICVKLQFKAHRIFQQSFEKPNLSFSAFNTPHKINKLVEILANVNGTALVYVRNRRRTKEIAKLLQQQGISATYYNAGLSTEERNERQEAWLQNKVRVMACTNAFGMGIDKAAVRTVVHMDIPDCIESYYQEAGRAGRDGKKAYAVLLYSEEDITALGLLPDKKFPGLDTIRSVYQAICNYLQIPVDYGEGNYYNFNLADFADKFKLDPGTTINVLQTLQQAGYISFTESVFISSKVGFHTSKNNLYEFEKTYPQLEPLLKALLRSYEGIFDNTVSIQEGTLARLTGIDKEIITQQLQTLQRHGLLEYLPKKDSPQVFFMYDRVSAERVTIDLKAYEARKKKYAEKIQQMVRYARTSQECRSSFIRKYFGDSNINNCGICDNCLLRKQSSISHQELLELAAASTPHLASSVTIQQLRKAMQLSLQQAERLLEHLIGEELIEWDHEGRFKLKPVA